jgi:HEAT repeat protein
MNQGAERPDDVEFLINALTDPGMRLSAAHKLGTLKVTDAVPALIRNTRVRTDIDRNAAVWALGRIGDRSAVPALREVATEDEAVNVRMNAIESLALLNDRVGIELLTELARDPEKALEGTSRYLDLPAMRTITKSRLRSTRRWAAKRLKEIQAGRL